MALKAGYYGVKKSILANLAKLADAKIIKSVGAGLNFNSSTGALSCKSATANQAGIAKSSDYLAQDIQEIYPITFGVDPESDLKTAISVEYDTLPTDNTGLVEDKLITSKGVYTALLGKYSVTDTPLDSTQDLDDIKAPGIYSVKGSKPANSPENVGWYALMVFKISDSPMDIEQVVFKTGTIYKRAYTGDPLSWTNWYKFSGTQVTP